ncbi:NAD(P)H-dependent oxidoreductase [Brachybacterium sp. EF45031]|uniref:NADPH-dependent FMN reductase n=1 Tax=Brachybacterium sillae TaxID=2810536 RepID=UPI00217ED79C|nr:NAD(P)H-dependent oxidoreductase [Brachybacterium sillae]MCS6710827.1 NAD(P)H-dependent oxidoreductase [Brachybacterium sillae]
MPRPVLGIIIASIRPQRVGDKVARWIAELADSTGEWEVDLIDLAEVDLPLQTGEPKSPMAGNYTQEHTKRWSRRVNRLDAIIIVTPEYNHGYPAQLKLALDSLGREWAYKPLGFASYGGISGGLRAVAQLKLTAVFLRMVVSAEALVVPMVHAQIVDGRFEPTDQQAAGTERMLTDLAQLQRALAPLTIDVPVQTQEEAQEQSADEAGNPSESDEPHPVDERR